MEQPPSQEKGHDCNNEIDIEKKTRHRHWMWWQHSSAVARTTSTDRTGGGGGEVSRILARTCHSDSTEMRAGFSESDRWAGGQETAGRRCATAEPFVPPPRDRPTPVAFDFLLASTRFVSGGRANKSSLVTRRPVRPSPHTHQRAKRAPIQARGHERNASDHHAVGRQSTANPITCCRGLPTGPESDSIEPHRAPFTTE